MHSLFELNKTQLVLNPLVLSIEEFEKIWKRDKTKDKLKAIKELTYIYAMCSYEDDNIWKEFTNLDERSKQIITDLYGDELKWSPDRIVTSAITKYNNSIPRDPAELLMDTLKATMMKIKEFYDDIDLNERDDSNKLVHNAKNIIDVANKATQVYIDMEETMEKIRTKKALNNDRIKGGGTEGLFEDADIMNNIQ